MSRRTLARVAGGRVIANHRPTVETERRIELLLAAVGVLRFDPTAVLPEGVPDTYEKLFDRAIEQFLSLQDARAGLNLPLIGGPTAKRRSIWVRGDLMLRVEEIAGRYECPVSRLIDTAIDSYVDRYTRGIDPKLVATLTGTAQKILDGSETAGRTLGKRRARKKGAE